MIDPVKHIEKKFNDDVDEVQLTRDEWVALRDLILVLRKDLKQIRWQLAEQD